MKKIRINDLLLLPFGCIPYVFLALYADKVWGTPLLYFAALLIPGALCWRWERRKFGKLILTANGVSAAVSGLLTFLLLRAQSAYFKPLGALGMWIALSLVSWMAQYLIWMRRRTKTPDQSLLVAICLVTLLVVAGVFCLLIWKAALIGAF